jgi:4-hydroxymandelate oxidase
MDLATIKENAREKMKGYCRVCSICNGKVCAGEVPGMGGVGTGSSFIDNLTALNKIKLNMRTIHNAKEPKTNTEIFGFVINTPILAAPITGSTYNMGGKLTEAEYVTSVINGSIGAGTLGMTGDGADPYMYNDGLAAISAKAGAGIPIIKPRSQEEIITRIKAAEKVGAKAIGVDIDGAGLVTMALKGQPVGPKTKEELKEIISATNLPFILKGIMTVEEAKLAVEVGAKAIVVSNHGGRVLDHTPGAAEVLADIALAVGDKITIFADGGVRTGADVLKLLALGAHGVLVGRPLIIGAFGGGAEGVQFTINKMTNELKQAMILTGCASIKDINKTAIIAK